MAHALCLLFEFLLLTVNEMGSIQFVILILHEVGLTPVVLYFLTHPFEFALLVLHHAVCLAVISQFLL